MPCTEATPDCAVYRPRNPRASPLYRCVQDHAEELRESGHIHRRVEEEVLAPVPHRQYVLTVPKVLRGAFHQRHRLGELCRIVRRLLSEAYQEADPDGQPGFILFVQTFGDLVTFHPHIHALVTDGVFRPDGVFRVLPPVPAELLEQQLRRAVLGEPGTFVQWTSAAWRTHGHGCPGWGS